MRAKFWVIAAALGVLPGCSQLTPGAAQASHAPAHGEVAHASLPTEGEIAALFDRWNATLQNGGPHDMALLYAENGVLLPTVSNVPRSNRVEIGEYFEHFLALSPRGTINERYIAILDDNTAIDSGIYTFDILRNGVPDFVVARYSYVYERVNGRWQIQSHHSSAMPEPVSARPPRLAVPTVDAAAHGEDHAPAAEAHGAEPDAEEGHSDNHGDNHGGGHH